VRLALCQLNATVGDILGNAERIRAGLHAARDAGAELVLFPELAITGYPPEDLLLREHFLTDARSALEDLARSVHGPTAIVGFPELSSRGGEVYNAAAVLADGAVKLVYRKLRLPNYGVFDERRYFAAGVEPAVVEVGATRVGVTVCEDLWTPGAPASTEAAAGATLLANISASPYHAGKGAERERLFGARAREHNVHVAFCGLVGGQDELVFDGHSFVLDPTGETIARAAQFAEDLLLCDLDPSPAREHDPSPAGDRGDSSPARERAHSAPVGARDDPSPAGGRAHPAVAGEQNDPPHEVATEPERSPLPPLPPPAPLPPLVGVEPEVYAALTLGLRDYVRKNGFSQVVLGLSGGIDSALVACLAADALGAERVNVAIMPSPHSSAATQDDARALATALGARAHELPIEPAMDAYTQTLREDFDGLPPDLTEENLQARIRGNLLMALSNKFGWLVLATGNKSEMSVGYTTLYGDLAGGFAVIKDVPKTLVYRLCAWRNSPAGTDADPQRARAPIPLSIIARPPSAELRPDQRDDDSLPPYELLDRILQGYIELDHSREQLIAQGLPQAEVDRTIRLVDLAEYKRRQAPPGIKVTARAFGRDRRMPITNRYQSVR
jgi:NAD+ synthase (glutamine-hydrolysing)